jgi:predicted nucleic acid-binding protein
MKLKEVSSVPQRIEYVLDSYAILAYLENETGSERVKELLENAKALKTKLYLCVVNLGEVLYIVERERGLTKAQETLARLNELPVEVVDAGRSLTLTAAHLKAGSPVAYADCFAGALALSKNALLVTGDPEFKKIKADTAIQIEWLVKA